MSWQEALAGIFLWAGIFVVLLSCVGVMLGRDPYARLHFLGPATILGSIALALAVVVKEGLAQPGRKAILIAVVLLVSGPILTHAIARVIYSHTRGGSFSHHPHTPEERKQ